MGCAIAPIALLLLLRCSVMRCPEGTAARYDQCVRSTDERDGGADGSRAEAGPGSGDAHLDVADSTADGACGNDRLWTGERCVFKEIFVDARDGDDANEGTQQLPLRTFKQAMRVAVGGQIVSFEGLTYTTDQGEDFTVPIPDGVTLRARRGSITDAEFRGDGQQTLTFAGSASLDMLTLKNFPAVTARSGKQHLSGVSFSGARISGSAEMHCDGCSIGDPGGTEMPVAWPLIEVRDEARLTFVSGHFGDFTGSRDIVCRAQAGELVRVTGTANLVLRDTTVRGDAEHLVYLETQGSVKIISSTLDAVCTGGRALAWRQVQSPAPTSWLEIERSTFKGSVIGTGTMQRVQVRRSRFETFVISSLAPVIYDLGLPGDDAGSNAGENTFSSLSVSGNGITVFASGNQWHANVQGADPDGHYRVGDSRVVTGGARIEGSNFTLTSEGGRVELLF